MDSDSCGQNLGQPKVLTIFKKSVKSKSASAATDIRVGLENIEQKS